MNHNVKIFKYPGAVFQCMSLEASGYDLASMIDAELEQFKPTVLPVGVFIAMPRGLELQIRPRSGLSRRGGLAVFGTIDADYRGELGVTMINFNPENYIITKGQRIAQAVFAEVPAIRLEEVGGRSELGDTERGEGGYGSTGI